MARLLSAIALATCTALPLAGAAAGFATGLTIKGEFQAGVSEGVGIDNIEVSAVPEPAQAALLLGGLALLAGLRRKR